MGFTLTSILFWVIAAFVLGLLLAWLAYRPLWSVPILIVSVGIIVWLCMRTKTAVDNGGGYGGGGGGGGKQDNDEQEVAVTGIPVENKDAGGAPQGAFSNALG